MRVTGNGWGSVPVNGRGGWPGGLSLYARPTQPSSQAAVGSACLSRVSRIFSPESRAEPESQLRRGARCSPPLPTDPFRAGRSQSSSLASSPLSRHSVRNSRLKGPQESSYSSRSTLSRFLSPSRMTPLYYPSSARINRVQYQPFIHKHFAENSTKKRLISSRKYYLIQIVLQNNLRGVCKT